MRSLSCLLLALLATTALTAAAAAATVDFEQILGYTLAADGHGVCVRSMDQNHTFGGSWSARLYLPDMWNDFSKVRFPAGGPLRDNSGTFWYFVPGSGTTTLIPYMYFWIDSNGNGIEDYTGGNDGDSFVIAFITGGSPYVEGAWSQSGLNSSTIVHVVGNRTGLADGEFSSSNGGGLLSDLYNHNFDGHKTWGDLNLLEARVGAGEWPESVPTSFTSYVDDIVVTSAGNSNPVTPTATNGLCLGSGCGPVAFQIVRTDAIPMRGYSVTFQLSPELVLCSDVLHSVTQGTYLSSIGGTDFEVTSNGGGSYTVDCAILGGGPGNCGQSASSGTLFNVSVKEANGDGVGQVAVASVTYRDCNNAPIPGSTGAPAWLWIDTTPPGVVTSLAATQVKSGNDHDGTTKITLTFAPPADADLAGIEVYRAPYGVGDGSSAYPEYNDVSGAGVPSVPGYPPGPPWVKTGVTATGQTDEVANRGYWYYVAFAKDACNNVSVVSNETAGTLNYHLGDVSTGDQTCQGDNLVGDPDISFLGAHYGIPLAYNDPQNCLDVGPTQDSSVNTMPTTDNKVNFEDLMIFAMNYGMVSLNGPSPAGSLAGNAPGREHPILTLTRDVSGLPGTLTARLHLENNQSAVKGIHAVVAFDASKLELIGVTQGSLLSNQDVFFKNLPADGGVAVDLAALGQGATIQGSGEVAVLSFRLKTPGAIPALQTADLRDRNNHFLGDVPEGAVGPTVLASPQNTTTNLTPMELRFDSARPNPFTGSTDLSFQLPAETGVRIEIHDVSGRLIRTVLDQTVSAGEHVATWDGRNDAGNNVGAGVYLCTFRAGDFQQTQKLFRYR